MSDKTYLSQIADTVYNHMPSVSFGSTTGLILGYNTAGCIPLFLLSGFVSQETFNDIINGYKTGSILSQLPGTLKVIGSANIDLIRDHIPHIDDPNPGGILFGGLSAKIMEVMQLGVTVYIPVKIASYINDYMNPIAEVEISGANSTIPDTY